jgi:CobQ-like glutamine amidotransferase family enzyme
MMGAEPLLLELIRLRDILSHKKIGLQTFNGAKDYKQEFAMTESKRKSGRQLTEKQLMVR